MKKIAMIFLALFCAIGCCNAQEVGKRKRIMILFVAVFILLSFFKMSTALKGCASDKETQMADTTQVVKGGAEDSRRCVSTTERWPS